jgi:hypothetical protein
MAANVVLRNSSHHFSQRHSKTVHSFARLEYRIALYINPVGTLRRLMATKTIFLVVCSDLFTRRVSLVQCPPPSIAP